MRFMNQNFYRISVIILLAFGSVFFSDTADCETPIHASHNQITEACAISAGNVYSDIISAHETAYYRASFSSSLEFHIKIQQGNRPVPNLINSVGNSLPFHKYQKNSELVLTIEKSSSKEAGYLFLSLKNPSVREIRCSVRYLSHARKPYTEPPKQTPKCTPKNTPKSTPKSTPKKTPARKSTPKPALNPSDYYTPKPATPRPFQTPSAAEKDRPPAQTPHPKTTETLVASPHFLYLQPNQKKKLTLSVYTFHQNKHLISSKKVTAKKALKHDFIWFSTDKAIADIKEQCIYAKKTGIAIIYIKHKTKPAFTSSVLVRVYSADE